MRTNKICSAPLTIAKSLQQNAVPQLAPDQQQPPVLQEGLRAEGWTAGMGSALELLLSLGSLGTIHHPFTIPQQTNPLTGTAPWLHLWQPCDTQSQQGCSRARQMDWALPRARLHSEAAQGWELSHCRLCKQTIVFNGHWLFLSLFSHFLKSLTQSLCIGRNHAGMPLFNLKFRSEDFDGVGVAVAGLRERVAPHFLSTFPSQHPHACTGLSSNSFAGLKNSIKKKKNKSKVAHKSDQLGRPHSVPQSFPPVQPLHGFNVPRAQVWIAFPA